MSEKRRDEAAERSAIRTAVFERDGWRCALESPDCRGRLEAHDIRKRSQGGVYEPSNLISLCGSVHHADVERMPLWAWEMGLVIRAGDTADDARLRRLAVGIETGP